MKLPRNAHLWLPSYLSNRAQSLVPRSPARRLWVAITDHFEPMGYGATLSDGLALLEPWQMRWPEIAAQAPVDATGAAPCFTAFYPQEEYHPAILDILSALTHSSTHPKTFDVEIHLHHDQDTPARFTEKISTFVHQLHTRHGLLRMHEDRLVFGFIHGNWALDNSRPDGRWCGVTGELQLLRDLGCYADFTMPSMPSPTQSRILNRIYWTNGDPKQPRGFDRGTVATPGGGPRGDLLMIPGPAGLRFRDRVLPRIETGELAAYDLPTPNRVRRWLRLVPRLGDDLFLKLYGHSARRDNASALLGTGRDEPGALASLFHWLHEEAHEQDLELHWVSAFDLFRRIQAILQPSSKAR